MLFAACDSANDDSGQPTDVSVLFAYSGAVADSMGDPIEFVRDALASTNAVYRNGRIPMRLVAQHLMQVEYAPGDRLQLLERLLTPDDGTLDEIHAARDQTESDVVVLITAERSATINASILATPETAFVLVWWQGLGAPLYGMAHEIAHLQGARHETLRDPENEPFAYGHGFRSESLKTIMGGGPPTLVPYFSGPDQVYQGVVLGDSSTANVARVLRETAAYVANFRGPQTPTDFVPSGTWPTLP